jgi:hypothetical protein
VVYNLKKYLKFINKPYISNAIAMPVRKQVRPVDYPAYLCVFLWLHLSLWVLEEYRLK